MSDTSGGAAVLLERPVRPRRSWLRRLLRLAIVCLFGAAVVGGSDIACFERGHDCAIAVRDDRKDAVAVCQRAYGDTNDPAIGVLLAKAELAVDNRTAADEIAHQLLSSAQRSDALSILGQVAYDDGRNAEAVLPLEEARQLHGIEHRWAERAGDDGLLSGLQTERDQYANALRLVADCFADATQAKSIERKRYCHTAAASTLIQVGYWSAAEREIEFARQLARTDKERSSIAYQRGSFESEIGDHARAIASLKRALDLRLSAQSQNNTWLLNTELNLAYSYAEEDRISDAQHYLKEAALRDSDGDHLPERIWVEAEIAYRQYELANAAVLIEKYFGLDGLDKIDRDERIDVASLGARIALERNDLESARHWAQRGVDLGEQVRRAQTVLELRPWVLDKRRAPYELLFVALARSQRIDDAALIFDQWQGRTVQDALARSQVSELQGYRGMADRIERLGEWLRVASHAPFARSANRDAVLHTVHDIDLFALIVANKEVWRLTASHGPLQLTKLGPLDKIKELIDGFRGRPTDARKAAAVAAQLLPDDVFRPTHEALHVLIDGQLAGLPVAALRRGDTPLVAMRPVVNVLRIPENRCAPVMREGRATVLGDPEGRFPNMRQEAEQVASLLHTTPQVGPAATAEVLRAAAHDAVLHVATHGKIGDDGAALQFVGADVSALEISALQVAPSLAVLSACDAAAVTDDHEFELAGTLVAGFLGAGSQHVVAALSRVTDAGAPEVATRFYRAGGRDNPVRALAAVQAELAKTDNVDWPHFAVFGPDVCPEGGSRSR